MRSGTKAASCAGAHDRRSLRTDAFIMGPNGNATGAPAWTFATGGSRGGRKGGVGQRGGGRGFLGEVFWEKVWREFWVGGNGVVVYFGLVGVDLIERIGGE